jgi:hypothetical protein
LHDIVGKISKNLKVIGFTVGKELSLKIGDPTCQNIEEGGFACSG